MNNKITEDKTDMSVVPSKKRNSLVKTLKKSMRPLFLPLIIKKNEWKQKRAFINYIRQEAGRRAFIIGSPDYTNLGDSAIFLAEKRFLERSGYTAAQVKEITYSEYYQFRDLIHKTIKPHEMIYGLGGGNMGNQWPREEQIRMDIIRDFPDNKVVVFPQTIHFIGEDQQIAREDSVEAYNRNHITIIAREKHSFEMMKQLYPKAAILLAPDIVLSETMEYFGTIRKERTGVLMLTRSDPEKRVEDSVWDKLKNEFKRLGFQTNQTDMYSTIAVTRENRAELVRSKMQEFCSAEMVVTDRLHGMIFAALTGTPCIVFSNYNHKVKGTYDWIYYLPYIRFVESAEEAIQIIPELLTMKDCQYDNALLIPYFNKVSEIIKENMADSRNYRKQKQLSRQ